MNGYAGKAAGMMFALLLGLAACQDNPAQQYGDAVIKGHKDAQKVRDEANVESLRRAAQQFHAMNGRYPADLDELQRFAGITIDGNKYDYDPETGMITPKQ